MAQDDNRPIISANGGTSFWGPINKAMAKRGNKGAAPAASPGSASGDSGGSNSDDAGAPGWIPSYKKGGVVRKTGLAKLHKGERVLTKAQQKKFGKR